jgi:hypothetical protein
MTALHGKDHERGRQPTRSVAFGDGRLTIADRLEHHAHTRSDRRAFSFLQDGGGAETRNWAELAAGARAGAAVLADLPRTREQPRAVVPMDRMTAGRFDLGQRLSWRDPDIGATLVLSQPAVDPDLWAEFSLGAAQLSQAWCRVCPRRRCAAQRSRGRVSPASRRSAT